MHLFSPSLSPETSRQVVDSVSQALYYNSLKPSRPATIWWGGLVGLWLRLYCSVLQ
ncbi:hypothetical protein SBA4_3660008 [Candidatus Sulfopaludibacter sp. SbA4]|nr:hypothetical protein SBA4_3660008 [Candidatus Sulfopaludibacter sp. SbA4]